MRLLDKLLTRFNAARRRQHARWARKGKVVLSPTRWM